MDNGHATVGDLLGRCLRAAGVTRVFGASSSGITGVSGLGHLRVDDPRVATLLADTHGRVTRGRHPGAALLPGRRLHVGSQPGAPAPAVPVTDAAALPELLAEWFVALRTGAVDLELDLDLDAPAPVGAEPLEVGFAGAAMTLSPSLADLGLVVLAGPGVARAGRVDALRAFAAQTGLTVIETPGGRGLLPSSDPYHGGTIGLQERDRQLAGLDAAGAVVTVGLDPDEEPPGGWTARQTLEVDPAQLDVLGLSWPAPAGPPEPTPLITALDPVIAELVAMDAAPLTPARAAADLRGTLRAGGVVAADAGPAGLWVLRALPAGGRPGGGPAGDVVVPSRPVRGFAVAAAVIAALDHRAAVAVTVTPHDAVTQALLELAGRVGSRLTVVEWGADVTWSDARAHRVALAEAERAPAVAHVPVPVDLAHTRALVEVAGPVVAWSRPEEAGFLSFGD
jgi:hypothetical protein